ncbi:kinase-like domain-containing protein [Mucidula mucida]|nr:kinase-like domain-containing protein [Mucidula mucida]
MKLSLPPLDLEHILGADTPSPIDPFSWESLASDPAYLRKLPGTKKKVNPATVKPLTLPDNRLLRYQWKSTIGAGAFGRVQLVRSLDDGNCYAIKTITKSRVIHKNEITHTNNEAAILTSIRAYYVERPFVIELSEIFQDSVNLYMVMEYVPGGELCTLLRDAGRFSENEARFYLSEVLMALVFLHRRKIMYRDLKTENILIGRDGHIKLADFGLASTRPYSESLVGTPDYMAPEILLGEIYDHAVDYYAFGVLVYELLSGTTPYHISGVHFPNTEARLDAIADDILAGPRFIKWPPLDVVSPLAKLLITNLMCIDPKRRLGNGEYGVSEILTHLWFKRVNWRAVEDGMTEPPYIPRLEDDDDDTAFELHSDADAYLFDPLRRGASERDEHGKHFENFPYVGESVADHPRWV